MKMEAAGVTVVRGEAVIERGDAQGVAIACDGQVYEAKNLLICTGSEAFVPPIPGIEDNPAVLTNREMLALTEAPASLVVIGGGVIGMEFASFCNSLGIPVTVIEMMPGILGGMDKEATFLFAAVDECRFRRPVRPGDKLTTVVNNIKVGKRLGVFEIKGYVDGELAADATVKCMLGEK